MQDYSIDLLFIFLDMFAEDRVYSSTKGECLVMCNLHASYPGLQGKWPLFMQSDVLLSSGYDYSNVISRCRDI